MRRCLVRSRRIIPVLVWLLVWCGLTVVPSASGDGSTCQPAELFAADESPLFEPQAVVTIALTGAAVTGSTPVDGVFWSNEPRHITYERAREFHLCGVDEPTLHTVAEALRSQFNQGSVLTFEYLPRTEADAVIITVPDIDIARFRDAFVADSAAHQRLRGGSVTTADHILILVAGNGDLDIAHRLVGAAGGRWSAATIAYGRREFVNSA
nr:hypothetical protein [Mycobacterium lacus]